MQSDEKSEGEMVMRDVFDSMSPADYRAYDEEVAKYISENGRMRYILKVAFSLVQVLWQRHLCGQDVMEEIHKACQQVTTAEVYKEERRIKHDMRALVNLIRARVSDKAKPFVHMTATSYDLINTADAARFKDVVMNVVTPTLKKFLGALITLAKREADTIQIGRTHGQHAVPITFGYAMAGYVSRLGGCIEALEELAQKIPGKFSGAVGAYNASSLFFQDPEEFEKEILAKMGLIPAEHSTQIVPPEALTRLFSEMVTTAGVVGNLCDDLRNLQRTEIDEVRESFGKDQVGSSAMPQKRNPVISENGKSIWKVVMPRMITIYMDQISEHQRDLTNSFSSRTYGEIIDYIVYSVKRLTGVLEGLVVNRDKMLENMKISRGGIAAEPLQLILSSLGHTDAHEKVRGLTLQAEKDSRYLEELAKEDPELAPYFEKMSEVQRRIIADPTTYTGIAAQKARSIAHHWERKLQLTKEPA